MSSWFSDSQKVGVVFCSGGALFLFLGVVFFFDRSMLSMGNILFLIGLPFIIGVNKTVAFFLRPSKMHGSLAFAIGICLILFFRWAFFGFLVECYGLLILFGDFFLTMGAFAGQIPVVGPYLKRAVDAIAGVAVAVGSKPQTSQANAESFV